MFGKIFKKSALAPEWIIVALGNPGKKYEITRHNAGFLFMDWFCQKHGINVNKLKFKAICGDTVLAGQRVCLIKPQTFMNLSGETVRDAAQFYKIPPERVLVIYDDVALPIGTLRIREKGSDAGHNGLKSIAYLLKSADYPRIKIGVSGPPHPEYDLADWVLSSFTKDEQKTLLKVFERCQDALFEALQNGAAAAASKYNGSV